MHLFSASRSLALTLALSGVCGGLGVLLGGSNKNVVGGSYSRIASWNTGTSAPLSAVSAPAASVTVAAGRLAAGAVNASLPASDPVAWSSRFPDTTVASALFFPSSSSSPGHAVTVLLECASGACALSAVEFPGAVHLWKRPVPGATGAAQVEGGSALSVSADSAHIVGAFVGADGSEWISAFAAGSGEPGATFRAGDRGSKILAVAAGGSFFAAATHDLLHVVSSTNSSQRWSTPRKAEQGASRNRSPAQTTLCFGAGDANVGVSSVDGAEVNFFLGVNLHPLEYMEWSTATFSAADPHVATVCDLAQGRQAIGWTSVSGMGTGATLADLNGDPYWQASISNETSADKVTSIGWTPNGAAVVFGALGSDNQNHNNGSARAATSAVFVNSKVGGDGSEALVAASYLPGPVHAVSAAVTGETTLLVATAGSTTAAEGVLHLFKVSA